MNNNLFLKLFYNLKLGKLSVNITHCYRFCKYNHTSFERPCGLTTSYKILQNKKKIIIIQPFDIVAPKYMIFFQMKERKTLPLFWKFTKDQRIIWLKWNCQHIFINKWILYWMMYFIRKRGRNILGVNYPLARPFDTSWII